MKSPSKNPELIANSASDPLAYEIGDFGGFLGAVVLERRILLTVCGTCGIEVKWDKLRSYFCSKACKTLAKLAGVNMTETGNYCYNKMTDFYENLGDAIKRTKSTEIHLQDSKSPKGLDSNLLVE